MLSLQKRPAWTILAIVSAVTVISLAMGAGRYGHSRIDRDILSKVQIINFNQSVARFDTTTGEIHRFNGDLHKPNVRCSWILKVKGVRKRTSGYLEIQHAGGGTFLIDRVTGDSWILRRRGANAAWDEVRVFH
ncbi:MAG: hypothetical protein JSV91_06170 [Phycisphaerales bacterium]|nr:MAG: hypothetical protein JSV91_06170 [Phycisphaerales bacterium]